MYVLLINTLSNKIQQSVSALLSPESHQKHKWHLRCSQHDLQSDRTTSGFLLGIKSQVLLIWLWLVVCVHNGRNTELQLDVGDNKDGTHFPRKFLDPWVRAAAPQKLCDPEVAGMWAGRAGPDTNHPIQECPCEEGSTLLLTLRP